MFKKYFWALSLVTVAVLSSCSKSAGYLEAVPSESMFALKADLATMVSKSEIMNESVVSSGIREAINSLDADSRELLRSVIDNPEESGIDPRKPAIAALIGVAPNPSGVITVAVKDQGKLETFITTLLKDSNSKNAPVRLGHTSKGVTPIEIENQVVGAFDDQKLVFHVAQGNMDAMEFMSLSSGKQAVNDKKFNDFFSTNKDIVIMYNYEKVMSLYNMAPGTKIDLSSFDKYFKDLVATLSIQFEKGKIDMVTDMRGNKDYESMVSSYLKNANMGNMEYVPQNATFVMNCGLGNLDKVMEFLPKESFDEVAKALEEVNLTIEDLSEINGDLTFALLPFAEMGSSQLPQPVLYVSCKGRKLFDALSAQFSKNQDLQVIEPDVYALGANTSTDYDWYTGERNTITKGNDLYCGYKEGLFFIVPSDLYAQIAAGDKFKALGKNFEDNRLYKYVKKNGMVFDGVAFFNDPYVVENMKSAPINTTTLLDYVSISSELFHGDGTIEFQNKEDNALKIIKNLTMQAVAHN